MVTRLHRVAAFAALFLASSTLAHPAMSQGLYDGGFGAQSYYDPVSSQDLFEGWWLGGTIGGSTLSYDVSPAMPSSFSSSGVLGGVVGGYSWQQGPIVLGVEGDFLATDISGGKTVNGGLNRVRTSLDTMADVRLRAGYTVLPKLLLFGTFGGAWGTADLYIAGPGGGFNEQTFFGWSAGGGAEYAYDKNWGLRFDYQYTDFDAETVSYPGGKQTFDPDQNTFRGSLIYRF